MFWQLDSRLGLVASFSRKITNWPNCMSCSAPAVMTLQFSACFTCVAFLASHHLRDPVARILLIAHTLEFFTLSHIQPLHDSHLNTGYLIAELQANLVRNKANKWLNKFNLTYGLNERNDIKFIQNKIGRRRVKI